MAVISSPGIGTIGGSVGEGGAGAPAEIGGSVATVVVESRSASPRSVTLPRSSVTTPARSTPSICSGGRGALHEPGDDHGHHRDDGHRGPPLAEAGRGPGRAGHRPTAVDPGPQTSVPHRHLDEDVGQLRGHEGEPDPHGEQAPARSVPGRRVEVEVRPGEHEDRPVPQVDAVRATTDPHQRTRAEHAAEAPTEPVTPGCTSAAMTASVKRSSRTKPPR